MLTPTLSSADASNSARSNVGIRPAEAAANSAVSWGAILAGAAAAAALSLILLVLGTGLGLSAMSPWAQAGATAATLGVSTIVWITLTQLLASGMGGYLAGRLRTKWVGAHRDEVFFRDTAHGFVTWAVASLFGVMVLASATSSLVGGGVNAAATAVSGAAQAAAPAVQSAMSGSSNAGSYGLDVLFRPDRPDAAAAGQDPRAEAGRILANGLRNGDIPAADRTYLAQLVARSAGVSQDEAQKRVDSAIAQAKEAEVKARQAADTARKAAATFSIFAAVSMLIGAFIASVAAAYGGNLRDEY